LHIYQCCFESTKERRSWRGGTIKDTVDLSHATNRENIGEEDNI